MDAGGGHSSKKEWLAQLEAEGFKKKAPTKPAHNEEAVGPSVALPARLLWVTSAFVSLSRARIVNETGPQPMNISDIRSYCELTGIFNEEDRRDLLHFLTEMDIIYLRHAHSKIEKGREEAKRKAQAETDRKRRGRR
jgi:hypothetical protein